METTNRPILELRVAITAAEYDRLLEFYTVGLGLPLAEDWTEGPNRAVLLEMGHGTLELFNEAQAEMVDRLEVGRRVSGPVRFALQVPDVDAAVERLVAWGAALVHPPVVTPWGDTNARVQSPDGMQITLFQHLGSEPA